MRVPRCPGMLPTPVLSPDALRPCPTHPGASTIVRASSPRPQGVAVCNNVRIIGTCPAPVLGSSDITPLYTANYGVPAVGSKVFVHVNQFLDGFQTIPTGFYAIVPDVA